MEIWDYIKKSWRFIAYGDSWQSWLTAIVLAFIIIKFILYPGLGLIVGSSAPVVAVVSESMEHNIVADTGNLEAGPHVCKVNYSKNGVLTFDEYWSHCNEWYLNNSISEEEFRSWNFKNGFNKGDIIFIIGNNPEKIDEGDVIVFMTNLRSDPIIHRVVTKGLGPNNKIYFQTKGDHNGRSDPFIVSEDVLVGKATFRVPWLGYVKIWFANLINMFR